MSAHNLMLLKGMKKEEDYANRKELEEVVVDYKLGIMDPGRAVAAFERQANIKRNHFGKKQIYAKLYRIFELETEQAQYRNKPVTSTKEKEEGEN